MENQSQPKSKPVKYVDLISQSEGEKKSEQLQLDVQKAKSNLEVSIAQTNVDLAEAKQKLADAIRAVPYNVDTEIAAFMEVQSLQDGLVYAKKVLKERF